LNNTCTNSKQTYNPIWQDHGSESLLHPLVEVDITPFVNDSILRQMLFWLGNIYFCFGSFTTFFFQWPFEYDVWTFTKLFHPKWLCERFQPLFQSIWAHCSRSCSTLSFNLVFYMSTSNVGKTIWKHTSHHDQWRDLLPDCPHIGYLV
jgi:hypothetical protein